MLRAAIAFVVVLAAVSALPVQDESPRARVNYLITQMTLEEKISLLHGTNGPYVGNIASVDRLGIPPIRMNDGPQGFRVDRDAGDGTSTAFPSGLNIAATFDPNAAFVWGDAMGLEFRAKGANVQLGPGLNVARVPRNGRNFEYMSGEDPILGRVLAEQAIKGIQQNKVIANAKHFINNNEEANRMNVSADVDERTEWEIYLQPFAGAVKGGVLSVMCSYNRINGTWACENDVTLNQDLKQRLGFNGWVMSDWGATHSTVQSANSGLDQEMPGGDFFGKALLDAVKSGEVSEATIDDKVSRILNAMIVVGCFDDPPKVSDPRVNVTSDAHNAIARDLAERSTVIVKNANNLLPLDASKLPRGIAVLGSAAKDKAIVAGGGSGHVNPPYISTGADALHARMAGRQGAGPVVYKPTSPTRDAVAAAKAADVAVIFVATDSGEGNDRPNLSLPAEEDALIAAVAAVQPNTIVVVTTPGAVLMPWADKVAGIAVVFMPGQEAGNAVARILFGDVNPRGRLPLTMPNIENEMQMTPEEYPGLPVNKPLHAEYSEKLLVGYRWYNAKGVKPLFCFGHGLTYTSFVYAEFTVHRNPHGGYSSSFTVRNTGNRAASDVVQLYVTYPDSANEPPRQLKIFSQLPVLAVDQVLPVQIEIPPTAFAVWDVSTHDWTVPASGELVTFEIGRSVCDIKGAATIHF